MKEKTVRPYHPRRQEPGTFYIHANGTITDSGHIEHKTLSRHNQPKKRRSAVTTFSKASASRLRRLLAQTKGPEGWICFGLTLTVPGPNIKDTEWRRLWRAFLARVRRLDGITFIWRIEKQERGQPHIHCVCWAEGKVKAARLREHWLENLALLGPYKGPAELKLESTVTSGKEHGEFKPGWVEVTTRELWPGACEHAVKIDWLKEKGDMCWWRYLASHASKSKQAQLGWPGRQWAVFNKRHLALSKPIVIKLTGAAKVKALRCLKRVTNSRRASNHGRQTWFSHPDTSVRLCEWAAGNCQPIRKLGCSVFSPFRMGRSEKRERAKAKRRKLLGIPICG